MMNTGLISIERQIISLGLIERELYQLYTQISHKVKDLAAKSLFIYIATDSLKHSTILVTILEEAGGSNATEQDCDETMRYTIDLISTLLNSVSKKKIIDREELISLIDTLASFENLLHTEYSKAFHLETIRDMKNEWNNNQTDDLDILSLIINDEEMHKRILSSIVNLCDKKLEFKTNDPKFKYQNPDSWYVPPRKR